MRRDASVVTAATEYLHDRGYTPGTIFTVESSDDEHSGVDLLATNDAGHEFQASVILDRDLVVESCTDLLTGYSLMDVRVKGGRT